ncbi:MAG: sugar-binding protein [Verrucomicrobiota bacterium]
MTHVTQRTETGFRVETRLPWASLNRAPPLPGQRIGFNVATTDHDDEPHGRERSQRTWTPKEGGDFKRSDRMGVLLLLSSSTDKDPMR